jgi:hypothetical protein
MPAIPKWLNKPVSRQLEGASRDVSRTELPSAVIAIPYGLAVGCGFAKPNRPLDSLTNYG